MLVPTNVGLTNGSGAGALVMSTATLVGGPTVSITFQWLTSGNRWREVARTA